MPLKPSHDLSTNSTLERSFQGKRTWVSGTVNPRRVSMRIHSIADLHLSSCFIEEKKRAPQLQTITVKHIWETYTPWIETLNLQCSHIARGRYGCTCVHTYVHVCVEARDCHGMSPNCSPLYFMRQGLSLNPEITDLSSSASHLAPKSPCWLANKHGD